MSREEEWGCAGFGGTQNLYTGWPRRVTTLTSGHGPLLRRLRWFQLLHGFTESCTSTPLQSAALNEPSGYCLGTQCACCHRQIFARAVPCTFCICAEHRQLFATRKHTAPPDASNIHPFPVISIPTLVFYTSISVIDANDFRAARPRHKIWNNAKAMNQLGFVLLCRKVEYKYSSSDAIIICRCVSLGKYAAIRYDRKWWFIANRSDLYSFFSSSCQPKLEPCHGLSTIICTESYYYTEPRISTRECDSKCRKKGKY